MAAFIIAAVFSTIATVGLIIVREEQQRAPIHVLTFFSLFLWIIVMMGGASFQVVVDDTLTTYSDGVTFYGGFFMVMLHFWILYDTILRGSWKMRIGG